MKEEKKKVGKDVEGQVDKEAETLTRHNWVLFLPYSFILSRVLVLTPTLAAR